MIFNKYSNCKPQIYTFLLKKQPYCPKKKRHALLLCTPLCFVLRVYPLG